MSAEVETVREGLRDRVLEQRGPECLPESALEEYARGETGYWRRRAIGQHLSNCPGCVIRAAQLWDRFAEARRGRMAGFRSGARMVTALASVPACLLLTLVLAPWIGQEPPDGIGKGGVEIRGNAPADLTATAYKLHGEPTGSPADQLTQLDARINALREVEAQPLERTPQRFSLYAQLAEDYLRRFTLSHDPSDLQAARRWDRQAQSLRNAAWAHTGKKPQ